MTALKIDRSSYKTGIDEIIGLKDTLKAVMQPVVDEVSDRTYWTRAELEESEYKRRDGFIPYSSNCGGIELSIIVPECEQDSWPFLAFGEHDEDCCDKETGDCTLSNEGYLDAKLRIWLKFEGIDADGVMSFYLYMGGGNGDAPYFRTEAETTLFETEFKARTLKQVKTRGDKAVRALLKKMRTK